MMDLKMEIYSPSLELLGVLEIQRSIIWQEKAFGAGSFTLDSLITDESRELLAPENIIWIEGETAGIIEYVQQEAGDDGPYITVKGRTLAGILDRRILWGLYTLQGTPPAIMNSLVDDCAINPTRGDATEDRKIPGLVLLDPASSGTSIQFQKTGGTLLDALEAIGEVYRVAFGVRFNPAVPQMEFWTRWGQDRSVNQGNNDPVFYSTELDDVLTSEYSYNSTDWRNVTLVAGEGEGANRVYTTVIEQIEEKPVTPPGPPTPNKYTVTLDVDPTGGGVASGGGTFSGGSSVTVTAAPSTDYQFVGWRENGEIVSTNSTYTFTIEGSKTLTAVFALSTVYYVVTVNADPSTGGTASGGGTVEQGQSVTLTQTTSSGYNFSGWYSGDTLLSTDSTYTFTPTGNITVTAKYSAIPVYTVTATIDPAGSGTVQGAGSYQEGTSVTIKAVPADGYNFTGWKEGSTTVSTNASYTFTITQNRSFTAAFEVATPSRLPAGYTEVEYIQSDGTQYIDTGLKPVSNTILTMEVEPLTTSTSSQYLFYSYFSGNPNYGFYSYIPSTAISVFFAMGKSTATGYSGAISVNTAIKRMKIILNSSTNKAYVDSTSKTIGSGTFYSEMSNIRLLSSSSATTRLSAKLYSCKISGSTTRDFVPCISPENVVGLYDLNHDQFYTKANTSGNAFVAGPAV